MFKSKTERISGIEKVYGFNNPKRFAQLSSIKSSSCPVVFETIHQDINGIQFKPIFIQQVADNINVVVWEEIIQISKIEQSNKLLSDIEKVE